MRLITHLLNGDDLAADANSSQLVNFPYALTAFITLAWGLIAFGWALVIWSFWLALAGSFFALLGSAMFGASLFDKS
jgi:hypothetical protein